MALARRARRVPLGLPGLLGHLGLPGLLASVARRDSLDQLVNVDRKGKLAPLARVVCKDKLDQLVNVARRDSLDQLAIVGRKGKLGRLAIVGRLVRREPRVPRVNVDRRVKLAQPASAGRKVRLRCAEHPTVPGARLLGHPAASLWRAFLLRRPDEAREIVAHGGRSPPCRN